MSLNERQERFVDEWVRNGGNAAKAAREAGYSEKYANTNARKLLQNTTITDAIKERQAELREQRRMTTDNVIEFFEKVVQGEIGEQEVTPSGKVIEVPTKVNNRIKAAENLGKVLGIFQAESVVEVKPIVVMGDYTEDENE
ncbi:terminase small subunit [Weissella sp. MSCH1]|uniref:terminase small subunit n=1 Tax=Weissella sp. MSCH1 TaxID=3383343 RepID=UPI0038968512